MPGNFWYSKWRCGQAVTKLNVVGESVSNSCAKKLPTQAASAIHLLHLTEGGADGALIQEPWIRADRICGLGESEYRPCDGCRWIFTCLHPFEKRVYLDINLYSDYNITGWRVLQQLRLQIKEIKKFCYLQPQKSRTGNFTIELWENRLGETPLLEETEWTGHRLHGPSWVNRCFSKAWMVNGTSGKKAADIPGTLEDSRLR